SLISDTSSFANRRASSRLSSPDSTGASGPASLRAPVLGRTTPLDGRAGGGALDFSTTGGSAVIASLDMRAAESVGLPKGPDCSAAAGGASPVQDGDGGETDSSSTEIESGVAEVAGATAGIICVLKRKSGAWGAISSCCVASSSDASAEAAAPP